MKKSFIFLTLLLSTSISFAADNQSHRIFMLETALAPTTPEAVANTWAKAAKDRNGAIQYMLMCPNLQKIHLANMNDLNWVTGVSSPWISDYKVTSQGDSKFSIQFQFSDSSGKVGTRVDHISIVKIDPASNSSQQWCISQLITSNGSPN